MVSKKIKTILFLAANPTGTTRLRLDREAREIEEGLKRSNKRDQFDFIQKTAVRVQDLRRGLLDIAPQIVHFSGHGDPIGGIALEDDQGETYLVPTDALADLFELCADHVEVVFLNACYSEAQADAIAKHIPYVIGMKEGISDDAAIPFSIGFYDALGAGKTIEEAYRFGCNAIDLHGLPEQLVPILKRGPMDNHSKRLGHQSMPDVYLDVAVVNEDSSSWNHGSDTILTYSLNRNDTRIIIQRSMGYISAFETGGPIYSLNYRTTPYGPFLWDFPIIDFKLLNNSSETVYLTEIVFDIEESRIDPTPLLTIEKDIQHTNAGQLRLVNEGTSDINDITIAFHLAPGDIATPLDTAPPYPHSVVLPLLTDRASIDITEAFKTTGVNIKGLIEASGRLAKAFLSRWVLDSRLKLSPDELSERMQHINEFKRWVVTLAGEISFRAPAAGGEMHHCVRFQAPVSMANWGGLGYQKPPTFTYNTIFNIDQVGYERRVQISHEIKPGETDRFTVKVAIVQSSFHRFRATVRDIRGGIIQSPLIEMTCFVPRSLKMLIEFAMGHRVPVKAEET